MSGAGCPCPGYAYRYPGGTLCYCGHDEREHGPSDGHAVNAAWAWARSRAAHGTLRRAYLAADMWSYARDEASGRWHRLCQLLAALKFAEIAAANPPGLCNNTSGRVP